MNEIAEELLDQWIDRLNIDKANLDEFIKEHNISDPDLIDILKTASLVEKYFKLTALTPSEIDEMWKNIMESAFENFQHKK